MNSAEIRRVIWAVDPFAKRVMLQRAAAWAILGLVQSDPSVVIDPVHLLNDFSGEGVIPQRLVRSFVEKITAFGSDSLARIAYRIPIKKNLRPLQVVARPFESVEEGVKELLGLAHRRRADLIVSSTRAGKGGGTYFSFLPGSFIETLTERSDIPILSVNPNWKQSSGISSVFFPTDLSPESHEWFLRTLNMSEKAVDKVTIFHKIEFPLSQPFETASRIFPEVREVLFRKMREAHRELKRWEHVAKGMGFDTRVIVDSDVSQSLRTSLLKQSEENPGALALTPPLSEKLSTDTVHLLLKAARFPVLFVPTLRRKAGNVRIKKRAA